MRERVLADLRKRRACVDGQQLVAEHARRARSGLRAHHRGIDRRSARQKAALAAQGVYTLGRYGSWTYCSIEDNIVEARALAARFNRAPS